MVVAQWYGESSDVTGGHQGGARGRPVRWGLTMATVHGIIRGEWCRCQRPIAERREICLLLKAGSRVWRYPAHTYRPGTGLQKSADFVFLGETMLTNVQQEIDRQYHPVADLFPLMDGAEFDELKADIASNGLLERIWLDAEGSIIDGRNRHRACIETETEPHFRTWSGQGSLVSFVVSMNLHRRHLNESQRAMIAAKIANMPSGARTDLGSIDLRSQPQAAQELNISTPSVKRAKRVIDNGVPELRTAVEQGHVAVSAAAEVAEMPQDQQQKIVAQGPDAIRKAAKKQRGQREHAARLKAKQEQAHLVASASEKIYNVILADPPWQYSNTGVIASAESHYRTMSTSDLCNYLSLINLQVADNSVLFLWVTNPLIEDAMQVISAWGFQYKTNLVWVKTELKKPGTGFYVRGRHELLFICTRGSFTPLDPAVSPPIGSVIESPVREHSRKPEASYDIIERLYPGCSYMELFARSRREKWDAFGNEVDKFSE